MSAACLSLFQTQIKLLGHQGLGFLLIHQSNTERQADNPVSGMRSQEGDDLEPSVVYESPAAAGSVTS